MGMLNLSSDDNCCSNINKAPVDGSTYDLLKIYSNRSNTLPIDSIYEIISYLDEKGLSRVSLVCKQWNTLANNHEIWNNLLLKKFCVHFDSIKVKPLSRTGHKTKSAKAKRGIGKSNYVDKIVAHELSKQQQQQTASAKVIFKEMSQAFDDLRRLKQVQPLKSNTIYLGYPLYQ